MPIADADANPNKWSQQTLADFVRAALDAGLGEPERRDLLLTHVPREVRDALPIKRRPDDQLRSDVCALAQMGPALFDVWLRNARELCPAGAFSDRLHAVTGRPPRVDAPQALATPAPGKARRRRLSVATLAITLLALVSIAVAGKVAFDHIAEERQAERRHQAAVLTRAGQQLQNAGRAKAALAKFREALKLTPDNANLRSQTGWAAFKAGHRVESERLLVHALDAATDDQTIGAAAYNLGRVHEDRGALDAAIGAYRRSLAHRRSDAVARRLNALLKRRARRR